MEQRELTTLIQKTLAEYHYELPPKGSTIGVPFSAEKMHGYVEKLRAALIEPHLQRFELQETYEQAKNQEPCYADYWVVAKCGDFLEWYDPEAHEFGLGKVGLGQRTEVLPIPVSIGVRGDLVGVFAAM